MAHVSQKISAFPNRPETYPSIASLPSSLLSDESDPTHEIRNLVAHLEEAAREARRHQRLAEEELDRVEQRLSENHGQTGNSRAHDAELKALIREKDMLLEQQSQYGPVIADLKHKLKISESERRETLKTCEEADRALNEALSETRQAEKRAKDAERRRDDVLRQCELARTDREDALEKAALAKKNFAEAQKALAEIRKELASAKKGDGDLAQQLSTLRQARDGMASQIKDLKQRVSELEDANADLTYGRDAAHAEATEALAKLTAIQVELNAAAESEAVIERTSERSSALEAELRNLREQFDCMARDREADALTLEQTRASLLAAQTQMDDLVRERDAFKDQLAANMTNVDTDLERQAGEVSRLHEALRASEARLSEYKSLEAQFDQRRLDMIELTVQLENAQREIRTLSANLAEARLYAKMCSSKAGARPPEGPFHQISGASLQPAGSPSTGTDSNPRSEAEATDQIVALRRCCQELSHDRQHMGLLIELESHARASAELGRNNGRPVLARVSAAFASLLQELQTDPSQNSQETLRSLNQTIELIAMLQEDPGIEQKVTLDGARVYVVDDDEATCAMVVESLKTVDLPAEYALFSSAAVAELAGNHYDLIILDVHLPDLDGFDLCSHIRNMAFHAETPVFFITGNTSLENRVKSSLQGGNEFIGKPFIIQELALKALKSIITSRLNGR